AKQAENGNPVIYLYSLADQKITPVTTDFTGSFNPVFDPDGKYLYFLSGRDFNEVLGVYDFEFANPKAIRVYAVTLRADATSPFAPQSDEVEIKKANPDEKEEAKPSTGEEKTKKPEKAESKKAGQKPEEKKPEEKKPEEKKPEEKKEAFRIDLDGIQNRVFSLPTPAESMAGLNASK